MWYTIRMAWRRSTGRSLTRIRQEVEGGTRAIQPRYINESCDTVAARLQSAKLTHDGIQMDRPTALRLVGETIFGCDHRAPWFTTNRAVATGDFRGCDNRTALVRKAADQALVEESVLADVRGNGLRWFRICSGRDPVPDPVTGEPMPETTEAEQLAAWKERQKLWNGDFCHYSVPDDLEAYVKARIAAIVNHELSSDLASAKQQLLSKLDRAIEARCRYLFDGDSRPSNANQRAARDAMLKHRQTLIRALRTTTTLAAAQTAYATAETAVNAVTVDHSPSWSRLINDGTEPIPASIAYTKGSGAAKWKLQLLAKTTARSHAASKAAGDVLLDDFSDANFEISATSQVAADASLEITIQRKGTGHPAAGSYDLEFTARNLNGVSTQTVTITVA